MATPNDPASFFREMLGEWEKMANSLGSEAMKSEPFARGMQGASAAGMTMQANMREMMEKALAAANLPTRSDIDAMAARLAGIEAALARLEASSGAAGGTSVARPRPSRGRKPPAEG